MVLHTTIVLFVSTYSCPTFLNILVRDFRMFTGIDNTLELNKPPCLKPPLCLFSLSWFSSSNNKPYSST
ncbi:MAG: hypothetical protein BWY04_00814 [candidate division CPR1 bacterium ADurb.Bin160]|uniref:Uncharacterized protein n=1 Tax=candidate division CPR1 bacterium ADurb.Bin160 TaxID=1852826 RepID=A0A1V5ZMF6_9BACT|nr:MAG: hypothetical protein BWY04_00814 [candidate division CPR1 bacterium ADurb.Bin160]